MTLILKTYMDDLFFTFNKKGEGGYEVAYMREKKVLLLPRVLQI